MLEDAAIALRRHTPKGDADALSLANDILEADPVNPDAMYIAGTALLRMKQHGIATIMLNTASQLKPDQAAIWNNLGCALQEWRPRDAVAVFAEALARDPKHREAKKNLAAVLGRVGRRAEAIQINRELWADDPDDHDVPYNLALDLLHTPDWKTAWECYRFSEGNAQRTVRNFTKEPTPRWDGKSGGRVVVYGEQGVGDEIWAASMYASLKDRADVKWVFECDHRLAGLFRRSFPWADVHGTRGKAEIDWPVSTPVDSAIIAFGLAEYVMPEPVKRAPWLTPDPILVQMFRDYLAKLGKGPKIGLAWTGGATPWERFERSIDPELLGPFTHVPNAVVVSLEYQDGPIPNGVHDIPWATRKGTDLDVTAALIAALDVVVSVPQTACDIAGAVGTPLKVLCPANPPWRFTEEAGDAWLWEDVVTYRRQPKATWLPAIARCAHNLREQFA